MRHHLKNSFQESPNDPIGVSRALTDPTLCNYKIWKSSRSYSVLNLVVWVAAFLRLPRRRIDRR